jgi:hypothetical protein
VGVGVVLGRWLVGGVAGGVLDGGTEGAQVAEVEPVPDRDAAPLAQGAVEVFVLGDVDGLPGRDDGVPGLGSGPRVLCPLPLLIECPGPPPGCVDWPVEVRFSMAGVAVAATIAMNAAAPSAATGRSHGADSQVGNGTASQNRNRRSRVEIFARM